MTLRRSLVVLLLWAVVAGVGFGAHAAAAATCDPAAMPDSVCALSCAAAPCVAGNAAAEPPVIHTEQPCRLHGAHAADFLRAPETAPPKAAIS